MAAPQGNRDGCCYGAELLADSALQFGDRLQTQDLNTGPAVGKILCFHRAASHAFVLLNRTAELTRQLYCVRLQLNTEPDR